MIDRDLGDGTLASLGKLVPEGLEGVELGWYLGQLGRGRFRRGDVLDSTENIGQRSKETGEVGTEFGRIGKGRHVDLERAGGTAGFGTSFLTTAGPAGCSWTAG